MRRMGSRRTRVPGWRARRAAALPGSLAGALVVARLVNLDLLVEACRGGLELRNCGVVLLGFPTLHFEFLLRRECVRTLRKGGIGLALEAGKVCIHVRIVLFDGFLSRHHLFT